MFHTRPLEHHYIDDLEAVLREHVRDSATGTIIESEVGEILQYMRGEPDSIGRTRRYIVACLSSDHAIACMAVASPDPVMQQHFNDQGIQVANAIELLNAFVSSRYLKGMGVGAMLFNAICTDGLENGKQNLIINSGPRYQNSWGFYDHMCDSSHGFIDNYYALGRHAKTWKKNLIPSKAGAGQKQGNEEIPLSPLRSSTSPQSCVLTSHSLVTRTF